MNVQTVQPGYMPQIPVMVRPTVPGCPPGLEYLTAINTLVVRQQVEPLEILTNFETSNKYKILNQLGQQVYFAAEEPNCCEQQFCGPRRGFSIRIVDTFGMEVIRIRRDLKICAGQLVCCACVNCCAHELQVEAPPGVIVGSVLQTQSCLSTTFDVLDAAGTRVLTIDGPLFACECCADIAFNVLTLNGQMVGAVTKKFSWGDLARELVTDADAFSVSFPLDLDVRLKAVLLGATFLVDFAFFEKSARHDDDN